MGCGPNLCTTHARAQVDREIGIEVGVIRSRPDDEYPEYIDMMRANADEMARLLK